MVESDRSEASVELKNQGFLSDGKINYERLKKTIDSAVHFLDNVIDMCDYPLKENREIVKKNRKIGLGVMGFADLLVRLCIAYDSEEGLEKAEEVMTFISKEASIASMNLAAQRGAFPLWKDSAWNRKSRYFKGCHMLLRNATITTIAPTGTISIIADVSSGIEPLFALSYIRRTAEGKTLTYFDKNLKKALVENRLYNEGIVERITKEGSIKNIDTIPNKLKKIFVVGSDIAPEWHVKMQAAFQKYVDNGISKTVTLPKDASVDDVEKIFMMAYELGCKGISVYRYGSREGQVIYLSSKRDEQITLSSWVRK